MNFYCTQLDHLDESWRMKQIGALFQANDPPHILAGGLNSLNGSDYSSERWTDIVKVRSIHNSKKKKATNRRKENSNTLSKKTVFNSQILTKFRKFVKLF